MGRRLVVLAGILGLALAALVLPASAQTAPAPPTIDNFFPRCLAVDEGSDVVVGGRSTSGRFVTVRLLSPTGTQLAQNSLPVSNGRYDGSPFALSPQQQGDHEVRVSDAGGSVSAFIQVPCQAPRLEFSPSCFTTGYSGDVTLIGRNFFPWDQPHTVTYDVGGSAQQQAIRRVSDGRGTVTSTFKVSPSDRGHIGEITQAQRQLAARATWSRCPPGSIPPTTTTSTTAPPVIDPGPGPGPGPSPDPTPDPTTTTARPRPGDPPPTAPPTLPPTIELPPPTPGATLTVTPDIGPPGFVTGVTGTGFPPGPVVLTWSPGIGTTTTIAGPDGTLAARVLILPGDRLGPRALVATAGATSAFDAFLVVPPTVQPSGQEVSQINRIRRFNNR